MSGINLNLPIDIPWTQIATSGDMLDTSFGGGGFPPKWRSSIAIFAYDPTDLPEALGDRRVTYFKIVCTITGHQSDRIGPRWVDFGRLGFDQREAIAEQLNRYFACYGALLQVVVAPGSQADRADRTRYPFIVDFEPKRRDLYEVVTDTGEVLSATSNRSAVNKGFTSTASSETGMGVSATGSYGAGEGGGAGASITGSWSDKSSFGTQDTNVTQIDHSREKRESQSHTTSLTQMYNLLQGYHVGTNRAVFLVLPRPHVVEAVEKRTFINGPREIEGVQEFFLIVSRPADVEHVCVEAFLETGHLDLSPGESTTQAKDQKHVTFDFVSPATIPHGTGLGDDSTSKSVVLTQSYTPPAGWEIDVDQGQGGYVVVNAEGDAQLRVTAAPAGLTIEGTVITTYHDVTGPSDYYSHQDVKGELIVFLRKKKETAADEIRSTFFITSRRVAGCTGAPMSMSDPGGPPEWVSFESAVPVDPAMFSLTLPTAQRMRLANMLQRTVGRVMLESLHAKPRYRPGAILFEQSQFALDRFVRVLRRQHVDTPINDHLRDLPRIGRRLGERIASAVGEDATAARAVAMPAARLQHVAGLETLEEAVAARWKLLGVGPRELPK